MPDIRWRFVAEPLYRPLFHINLSSPGIEWFGAGKPSHVGTILPAGMEHLGPAGWEYGARSDRVGGVAPGVRARPPDYAIFSYVCMATIPVTDEQWLAYWRSETAKLGAPYDSTAIWGFAAGRDWRAKDSWFCSEKNADCAECARIIRPLPGPVEKVTPPGLASIISQAPGVTFAEFAS